MLLNFTREEEDMLKQTLEYKVGVWSIFTVLFVFSLKDTSLQKDNDFRHLDVSVEKQKATKALFLDFFISKLSVLLWSE